MRVIVLLLFIQKKNTMSDQFFIQYKHNDMNPDYTGSKNIWANDAKSAIKIFVGRNTALNTWTTNKKGSMIKITSIEKL